MGWIKLDRKIQDHWVWDNPKILKAWISLLLSANHEEAEFPITNFVEDGTDKNGKKKYKKVFKTVKVRPGSFITSIRHLQLKWGVSKNTVYDYLNKFQSDKMIECIPSNRYTTINIVNWGLYQAFLGDEVHANYTENCAENRTQNCQQTRRKRNKEYKNSATNRNAFIDEWAAEGDKNNDNDQN